MGVFVDPSYRPSAMTPPVCQRCGRQVESMEIVQGPGLVMATVRCHGDTQIVLSLLRGASGARLIRAS
jgi:hypothetical protein